MPEAIPGPLRAALEQALRSSTRSLIFTELFLSDELSPAMLAERLGLDLNAVAYHMRRLASAGLIVQTRRVPYRGGVSQRFYQVTRSLRLSLGARPQSVTTLASAVTAEERRNLYLVYLLLAAKVLDRAASLYSASGPQLFDSLFLGQPLGTVAFGALPRPSLAELAQIVRDYLDRAWADSGPQGPQQTHGDFLVFAALPEFLTPETQT